MHSITQENAKLAWYMKNVFEKDSSFSNIWHICKRQHSLKHSEVQVLQVTRNLSSARTVQEALWDLTTMGEIKGLVIPILLWVIKNKTFLGSSLWNSKIVLLLVVQEFTSGISSVNRPSKSVPCQGIICIYDTVSVTHCKCNKYFKGTR